ncbi:MAG: hypothetical protein AAF527_02910 [Pseudomonadota bacterium]
MAESTSQTATGADDENLSFISNFNDIFLAIGLLMLAAGMTIACVVVLASLGGVTRPAFAVGALTFGGAAGVFWLLAEFFAGKKRQTIPGIAICLVFVSFTLSAVAALYGLVSFETISSVDWRSDGEGSFGRIERLLRAAPILAVTVTLIALGGFYARFKLPIASALAVYTAVFAPLVIFFSLRAEDIEAIDQALGLWTLSSIIGGVVLFVLGVWFDARDPSRVSRFSDNAFWMHFFAAPLMLQSAVQPLLIPSEAFLDGAIDPASIFSVSRAALVLGILFGFALLSVLINRRALIVAGLLYAGWAIGILMNNAGLGAGAMAAMTLVLLGGMVVVLGAGWHGIRRVLIAPFPKTGFVARIIPPEA